MTPERWQDIEPILDEALELEAPERAAFLDGACAGDPELRKDVEEVLAAADAGEAEQFLSVPAGEYAAILLAGETETQGTPSPRPSEPRFTAGTVLAERYRIVSSLGAGGMGEVYRADDLKLSQTVALKFLPEELSDDEARLALLFNEVKLARTIAHPNVCRVYDLAAADGLHFLSMEYVEGEDLASLLRKVGRLPEDRARELGRQIAEGLAAAHELSILHRDLKPANVMIDHEGRARITDFGLAVDAPDVRGPAALQGTPAYMAPEQVARREASAASDVYALGLVLYELFTGHRPFETASDQKAGPLLPDVTDPDLEQLIFRCLGQDPRTRPASAEVATVLAEDAVVGEEGLRLRALLGCDLVASTRLTETQGDARSAELFRRHEHMARDLSGRHGGREIDKTDGFLMLFERPWDAVCYALAYHEGLAELSSQEGVELVARVGIHFGEVILRKNDPRYVARGAKPLEIEGLAKSTVARLASLARGRQTLLTRSAFDLARRAAVGESRDSGELEWLAHGRYLFHGQEEAVEVFEVGVEGEAPLAAPDGSDKVVRVLAADTILGWRPAPGAAIPHRTHWVIESKVGEGGFGEVWLAAHEKTGERRVFKFCYEAERLRALQREITVFRLLKEELGERDDIARILDWNFDEPPYFIESVYTDGGNLVEWARDQGGLSSIPLAERLEIVAQVAEALSAAHSVGVLHKDVKPANVLISTCRAGGPQAVLTDFGVGLVIDRERLLARGITALGLSRKQTATGSSTTGTSLYMAPELLAGKAPTIQADVYALGVMLYQVVVGDTQRALAPGWQRDVHDELLCDDISSFADGSPEHRPRNALEVAERLRRLDERRAAREAGRLARTKTERARRRRRLLAAVAAVSSLFLVVVSLLAFQAIRARDDAERGRRQAEQLIDFMLGDLHDGLERIGRLDLLAEVAQSSREYFDSLTARDESDDTAYKRGVNLLNIGDVFLDQGDAESAEESYRSALELFEAADVGDSATWDDLESGASASLLKLGEVLRHQGEKDAALEALRAALEKAEILRIRDPENREIRFAVATIHHEVGLLEVQVQDFEAALVACRKALEAAEELTRASGEIPWRHWELLIDVRTLYGRTLRWKNELRSSRAEYSLARGLAERLAAEDSGNATWARKLAAIHLQVAYAWYAEGEYPTALESSQAAREAYRELARTDPTRAEWRGRLAESLRLIGRIHTRQGDPEKSLTIYREASELLHDLVEEDPTRLTWQRWLARVHFAIGSAHLQRNETSLALDSYRAYQQAQVRLVAASGDDPVPLNELSAGHILLGDVYFRLREGERARREWTRAVEIIEPVTARWDSLQFLDTHVQALLKLDRLDEAKPLVERLLAEGWEDPEFLRLVRDKGWGKMPGAGW